MIQKLLLVVVVLALLCSFTACGSKPGIAGTYVNQDGSGDYLELRRDGTFYMEEEGWKFTGDWEAKGNELRLSWMGFVVTGTIEGNAIIDDDGEVWVKGAATPIATGLAISPSTFSIGSGKSVELTATLKAGDSPLQDRTISWSATSGWLNSSSGTTDSSGQVVTTYTAPRKKAEDLPLTTKVTASFAGYGLHMASSAQSLGDVKIGTYIEGRLPRCKIKAGESMDLMATLRDDDDNPLPRKRIVLSGRDTEINSKDTAGGFFNPSSGVTNADGQIAFTYTAPLVASETVVEIEPFFPGDENYLESSRTTYAWLIVLPAGGPLALTARVGPTFERTPRQEEFPLPVIATEEQRFMFPVLASYVTAMESVTLPVTFLVTASAGTPVPDARILMGRQVELGTTDNNGKLVHELAFRIPPGSGDTPASLSFSAKKGGESATVDVPLYTASTLEKRSFTMDEGSYEDYKEALYLYNLGKPGFPLPKPLDFLKPFLPLLKVAADLKKGPQVGDQISLQLIEYRVLGEEPTTWVYNEQIQRNGSTVYSQSYWVFSEEDMQRIRNTYFFGELA